MIENPIKIGLDKVTDDGQRTHVSCDVVRVKERPEMTAIVPNQPLGAISPDTVRISPPSDSLFGETMFESTGVSLTAPVHHIDLRKGGTEDNNFIRVICQQCGISGVYGCDRCGLYEYGYHNVNFNIKATPV